MKKDDSIQAAFASGKKVYSLIGLSTRANFVASGEFMTERAVKERKSFLVIVAEDASDNTKKKFKNMCAHYEVPIYFFGDKDTIGHAMGKEFRASLSVNNQGMAQQIEKYLTLLERE